MRFGDFLKILREKNDFTRDGLGRRVGVTGPYISQIETGHRKPPPDETLQKLIDALGISPKEAVVYIGDVPEGGTACFIDFCHAWIIAEKCA